MTGGSFGARVATELWGTSSSPIIHKGLVFLQADNEQRSFVVALELETGKEVWRTERDEVSNWGSPVIWTNRVRSELVTAGKVIRIAKERISIAKTASQSSTRCHEAPHCHIISVDLINA